MTTMGADDFCLRFGAVIHSVSEFNPANAIQTILESTQAQSGR